MLVLYKKHSVLNQVITRKNQGIGGTRVYLNIYANQYELMYARERDESIRPRKVVQVEIKSCANPCLVFSRLKYPPFNHQW